MLTSLHISAIRILQLGRGDRDFGIARALYQLMGDSLRASLQFGYTAAGTVNVRTASSSIRITSRRINCAVHDNLRISKVCFCAIIRTTRSIYYRLKCFVRTRINIRSPLISIININVLSAAQFTCRTCINGHFCTGQHHNILINCNRAAVNVHSQITINRQIIFS